MVIGGWKLFMAKFKFTRTESCITDSKKVNNSLSKKIFGEKYAF